MTAKTEDSGADVIDISPDMVAPEEESSGAAVTETGSLLAQDLERLAPAPSELQLHDGPLDDDGVPTLGTWVVIQRLRTRQFFAMLRIVTRSAIPMLGRINLDPRGQSEEEFTTNLLTVLMLSIPEADEEAFDFLTTMVAPRDIGTTKEEEVAALAALRAYMRNPELEDTVEVIQAIVRREGPDLKALGRRLTQMFQLAQKTGQTKEIEEAAQAGAASLEASGSPST